MVRKHSEGPSPCGRQELVRLRFDARHGGTRAFRMARNDIVASLDADCIADARWLECLLLNMSDERVAAQVDAW